VTKSHIRQQQYQFVVKNKNMAPEKKIIAQNILIIIGIGLIFGLLYNFLFYPHTLIEFTEAGSISVLIGLFVGLLEEFVFNKLFQKVSFLMTTLIRSLLYALLISIVLSFVLSIEISSTEQIRYIDAVFEYLNSPLFQRDFIYSFIFIILILIIFQVILLIGKANFFKLTLGLYHHPREVSRIFMFVDLKGSTSIAEKLTNKQFSSLLKDYFYDVSDAIIMFGGEIYQYVGDEVIVMWPVRRKNVNCIRSFFKMEEIIESKKDRYLSKYGLVPEFKAGMHAGTVIVTTVGKQKKEIVYHGDVLNTTSRIEGKCNELKQKLLISEDMLDYINLEKDFILEKKDEIELRGKSQKLSLYGVKLAANMIRIEESLESKTAFLRTSTEKKIK
jgi:adenylate cyclase